MERILHEFLGRQCRLIQVPSCHAGTTNIKFTHNSDRHKSLARTQDIRLGIVQRTPYRT